MADDQSDATDNVEIVLRGPDGKVKQQEKCHNLITTVGRNAIVERLDSSPGTSQPTHMGIGTGAAAAAAGDTALGTELDRNALTSNTSSTNVLTMVGDWAAGDGTGAITEAGVFNAASTGTLYARAVFSVINKAAGDTLQITWTFTLTVTQRMVYCVQAQLAFRNAARRDAISQNIQTRLAQMTPWGEVVRQDYVNENGDPAVVLEVRFQTRAEQQVFWSDAINAVGTGINGPVTGSTIYRHDCPHDEANPSPCVVVETRNF